jgi:PAS domain-containing protein
LRVVPDHEATIVSVDERRASRPRTLTGYIDLLPDVAFLSRLQMPVLAVANDGIIVFANPACQAMLGCPGATANGRPLNHFLQVDAAGATDVVATLRAAAGQITTWRRANDEILRVTVSQPLLAYAEGLFVGLTDVTEWVWDVGLSALDTLPINSHPPRPSPHAHVAALDDEDTAVE